MMQKKYFYRIGTVIIILVVGIVSMGILGSNEMHSQKRPTKPSVRLVETTEFSYQDHTIKINGNGLIKSARQLNVLSEVNGQVVFAENNLKNGTYVKKDQLILSVDTRQHENDLYVMRSAFINAVASILPDFKLENTDIYSKWYNYFQTLNIHQTTPNIPEITDPREKLQVSSNNIFNAYYAIKNQEILLSKCKIKAPFDAFIISNGVMENSVISQGQHLFDLQDAVNLEVSVPLLVQEVEMLDLQNSRVKIYTQENPLLSVSGRITRKASQLNVNAQTLSVYVSFQNKDLLVPFLPGNYVNVEFTGRTFHHAAAVPRELINRDSTVYVMQDSVLAQYKVDILFQQEDVAILKDTLPDSLRLVTTLLQKPVLGMRLRNSSNNR